MGAVGAYEWNGAVLKQTQNGNVIPPKSSYLKEFPEELKNHGAYLGERQKLCVFYDVEQVDRLRLSLRHIVSHVSFLLYSISLHVPTGYCIYYSTVKYSFFFSTSHLVTKIYSIFGGSYITPNKLEAYYPTGFAVPRTNQSS